MAKQPRPDAVANWLDRIATDLTPSLWRLRVVAEDGTDTYVAWPDDGDWRRAILEHIGAGEFRLRLTRRAGRNTQEERRRLKLPAKPQWLAVDVADAQRVEEATPAPDLAEEPAPFDPSMRDDDDVRNVLRETARIEAECARVEAEHKLRRLRAGLDGAVPAGDAGLAEVMRQQAEVWREMLREAREREARLLAELTRRSSQPDGQAAGLVGLRESLGLVREVMSMTDSFRSDSGGGGDDDDELGEGTAGNIVRVLREARGLLGAIPRPNMERIAAAPPRAMPLPAAPATPLAPPAPAPAAPAATQPAEAAKVRVRAFVQQLIEELTIGSEPESVADELASAVGLLPSSVRQPIDAGSWPQAWQAIMPYIGINEWNQVDSLLASSPTSVEWLERFVKAYTSDQSNVDERSEA